MPRSAIAIPTDLGRPIFDLRHRLEYDSLVVDAMQVLDQLGKELKLTVTLARKHQVFGERDCQGSQGLDKRRKQRSQAGHYLDR
jgi:hypothetical protein